MIDFSNITGFDWDDGNVYKNFIKHKVTAKECEEFFDNEPIIISLDQKHSTQNEKRSSALGKTFSGENLFISFTLRDNLIRIISARPQSKNERKKYYGKEIKRNS